MLGKTKITADEMALMSLFESITGVSARDCIINDDRVTFLVHESDFPRLVRKVKGFTRSSSRPLNVVLEELGRLMRKRAEIVKLSEDIRNFIVNFFSLRGNDAVKLVNRPDGSRYAIIYVNPSRRGAVIGRKGYKAQQGRELAKRYYGLQTIYIR
jgi:N utilization substance protein A